MEKVACCDNCLFEDVGQCRRYPPSVVKFLGCKEDEEDEGEYTSKYPDILGDEWCGEWRKKESSRYYDIPVDYTIFSVRTANTLKFIEIDTVQDLLKVSPGSLLSYRNFGKKSLQEVEEYLKNIGAISGIDYNFPSCIGYKWILKG